MDPNHCVRVRLIENWNVNVNALFRRFLYLLLKSLLWLYFLEYRNQIYRRHVDMDMNMNPWKNQIDVINGFDVIKKIEGFRSFWTGMYIGKIKDSLFN